MSFPPPHIANPNALFFVTLSSHSWVHPKDQPPAPPEGCDGWKAIHHADHGYIYENPVTGETIWPSFPGTPTLPAAPAGWTIHPHAENGQYYHNAASGETSWTRPADLVMK